MPMYKKRIAQLILFLDSKMHLKYSAYLYVYTIIVVNKYLRYNLPYITKTVSFFKFALGLTLCHFKNLMESH